MITDVFGILPVQRSWEADATLFFLYKENGIREAEWNSHASWQGCQALASLPSPPLAAVPTPQLPTLLQQSVSSPLPGCSQASELASVLRVTGLCHCALLPERPGPMGGSPASVPE